MTGGYHVPCAMRAPARHDACMCHVACACWRPLGVHTCQRRRVWRGHRPLPAAAGGVSGLSCPPPCSTAAHPPANARRTPCHRWDLPLRLRGRGAEGGYPERLQERLLAVAKAAGGQGLAVTEGLAGSWWRAEAVGVDLAVTTEGEGHQGSIRMAVHHRRRGGCPPPPPSLVDPSGKQ